jgi:curved DNA-binding protein CbpA
MDAYAVLGLPRRLVLGEEELADACREAGKTAHPDAGGTSGGFSEMREARVVLASPSRRLRHWLELTTGRPAEIRGTIDATLMDVFSEVGEAARQADQLIRRREAAASALGRALLEGETQRCRERIESLIGRVDALIRAECADFPEWEQLGHPDPAECATTARNLAFLEKWRATLRACFSRLV